MTIQIRYNGHWRDLEKLRIQVNTLTDPAGFAGPAFAIVDISYDVGASEEPEQSDYTPLFFATASNLPTSTTLFDAAAAAPSDIDNWSNSSYLRVRAQGNGLWAVTYRVMFTAVGEGIEHQLRAGTLDGNIQHNGVPFPSVETHAFRIRTRAISLSLPSMDIHGLHISTPAS